MVMEQKYQDLNNLRDMMRVEKDLDLLLDFIVQETAKIVNAERASLFLYDEDTNQLSTKIALGTSEIIHINSNSGIAGEVFSTGKVHIIHDAYKNQQFNSSIDEKTGYKTKSILCVPLKNIEGKSIGVLQALNKKDGLFTSEDIKIIEILYPRNDLNGSLRNEIRYMHGSSLCI